MTQTRGEAATTSSRTRSPVRTGRGPLITYTTVVIVFVSIMVALVAGLDIVFAKLVLVVFG